MIFSCCWLWNLKELNKKHTKIHPSATRKATSNCVIASTSGIHILISFVPVQSGLMCTVELYTIYYSPAKQYWHSFIYFSQSLRPSDINALVYCLSFTLCINFLEKIFHIMGLNFMESNTGCALLYMLHLPLKESEWRSHEEAATLVHWKTVCVQNDFICNVSSPKVSFHTLLHCCGSRGMLLQHLSLANTLDHFTL